MFAILLERNFILSKKFHKQYKILPLTRRAMLSKNRPFLRGMTDEKYI
jgi:hypothetical protein